MRKQSGGGAAKPGQKPGGKYSVLQKRGRATKGDADLGDVAVVKARHELPGGAALVVALGDITNEEVGCLVNAANSKLVHGAGLAKAISKKGGPTIKQESEAWVKQHGLIETGQHAVTSGGALPCRHVLHVVGPIWDGGAKGEAEQLRAAMHGALRRCAELGCASLATPALSSGLFKFPKDLCAQILVDTAHIFLTEQGGGEAVREVRFTNFDSETCGYFERYFAQKYGGAACAGGGGGGGAAAAASDAGAAAAPGGSAAE